MDDESQDDDLESQESICNIDTHLVPAKIAYFINCARYAINEYLILFYVSIGFTSANAGLLTSLQLLGGIIAAPFWCLLADEKRIHRTLFTILCALAVIAMSLQPLLNAVLSRSTVNVCPYRVSANTTMVHSGDSDSENEKSFLYVLLTVSFIASVFDGSITSFVDCGTIQRMHTSRQSSSYGRQRIFGAFGYASGAIMYSFSIRYFPESNISCYTGIFVTYGILGTILTFSCSWLFKGISVKNKTEDVKSILRSLIKDFNILFFFACALCAGISQGIWYAFIFLYMKELDSPTLLLGFSLPMTCLTASLVFYYSGKIIDICRGPFSAMAFSFFAWSMRFLALAYINNPYLVIVIDILHGFTFSLFRTASLEYIKMISDPLITASMCGINNTMNTLGIMIANLAGGYIHDKVGSKTLFKIFALASLMCSIIMFLTILRRKVYNFGFQILP